MYLTAHRIRSSSGAEALHAFLHVHEAAHPWPQEPWKVPEQHPGRLIAQSTSIPPGGNSVISYLDIMSREPTDATSLRQLLTRLSSTIPGGLEPFRYVEGSLYIQFSAVSAIQEQEHRQDEFRCLARAAADLFTEQPPVF